MKKITFFLSALLISVMSFAADYPATNTSNVSFTMGTKAYDNKIKIEGTEYQAIKLGTGSAIGDMSFTVPANTAKIHLHIAGWSGKTSAVTISASNGVTLGTTEITATSDAGMTGNSPFTLSNVSKVTSDYYHVIELTSPTTEETTITMTSISGKYRVVIWGVNTEEATSGEQGETVDAPTFSATEANFTEAFNLTITSAEGTTLKYTTDKTDPTTSATAVVVESNTATVAISAKSTMVKAVAVKGELVSNVKSMTFCYVNSEATAYTVTEALAIYNEGLGLSNKLYIKGSVKSIEDLNTEYGNATYTITDGESDLYIYRGKNFGGEKFTSADQLFVDDDLVLYGQLTSYNGNPQVAANSEIISRESKTKSILAEDLTFDAIALGDEVEAQTLTVTGANLTAEITATLDNEKFTVTPATLPAAGGDLTIAPAADLTVGEHAATLTLTSGETTTEVTLSILVKDVYAIEWYVNGEIYDETTVVEGDKLVLPAAPEAPEACSEKVFVGWTAAEEVNADGSEIEWVTAATAPTAAATYYAVFALQEGEGGAIETSVSVNIGEYASANSWTNQTQYLSMSIDENITATITEEGTNHNSGKYYDNGTNWRIYQNESPTLTIAAAEGITISTVAVTYSVNNTGVLTLGGANVESGAVCEINAASVTFGVGNTGSAINGQVRITDIKVVYTSGAPATYTDYSTTCEPEIPTYTVTVSDNTGGFEPLTTGGGEYKEGENATVTASEEVEEWVFVGWMANEEFVANDPTYTFAVEGNTELVAVYAMVMEDEITNLVIETELSALIGGPSTMYEVNVFLGLGEGNVEEGFLLSDESYVSIMGEDATWIDGMAFDIDLEAKVATAIVVVEWNGSFFAFTLAMSAAPAEPIEVVVENATVVIEERSLGFGDATYSVLILTGEWSDGEITYPVSLVTSEFTPEQESQEVAATLTVGGWDDEDPWLGAGEGNATIAIVDNTVNVSGLFENQSTGFAANLTISGTLPAEEPEGPSTGLDNINTTVAPVKAIVNGQLVILKDGVQYNAQGAVIK